MEHHKSKLPSGQHHQPRWGREIRAVLGGEDWIHGLKEVRDTGLSGPTLLGHQTIPGRPPGSDLGRQGLWRHTSLQSLSGEGHGKAWARPWIVRWSSEPNASCRVQSVELSRKLRQKLSSLALLWLHRNSGVRGMSGLHQIQLDPHLRGLKLWMCLDLGDLGTPWGRSIW